MARWRNLEVLNNGAVCVPRCLFCLSLVRCPEGEVVAQELHDEGGVFVGLLGKRVELRDRIVERLRRANTASTSQHSIEERCPVEINKVCCVL